MAAQTIANTVTPRFEFYSPGGGSLVVKFIDSPQGIHAEIEISTATVLAMFGAALSGASPALYNGGAGGLTYIPKNVLPGANTDGRASLGGQLAPNVPVDVA